MLKDEEKLVEELNWLNLKSYMLCWFGAFIVSITVVLLPGLFPVGWLGFVLGAAAWAIITLLQRRMARKLADRIMKAHRADLTLTVDLRKLNFKK